MNDHGQLGLGHTDTLGDEGGEMGDNLATVDLGTGRTAVAVSAGGGWGSAIARYNTWRAINYNAMARTSEYGLISDDDEGYNGRGHTCVVFDDGELKCWGSGAFGQLGTGNTEHLGDEPGEMGDNLHPVDLGSGVRVSSVSAS